MLWDEPKIFFLERRYFFSIILSEFLKNRVALQKSRREIALLIVVLLLINQKTSSGPFCTRLVVYKYDNKRDGKKKDVN